MAKNNKIARQLKAAQSARVILRRAEPAKPAGLYLLELRSHHAVAQAALPKRKLTIEVALKSPIENLPKSVKIQRDQA